MLMLGIIAALFVLVIVSPIVFPNKTVSNHPEDLK
jgi:hypothetical protein